MSPRVLSQLLQDAGRNPTRTYRVIVRRNGKDTSADSYVISRGNRKLHDLAEIGFVAEVKGKDIADLGRHPAVRHVSIDAQVKSSTSPVDASNLANLYPQAVRATDSWTSNATGSGVGVAVVDTGIASLPDFTDGSGHSRIVAQTVVNPNTTNVGDGYGHGTHVAGLIGGNSWWNPDPSVQGKYVGVAPQVNLINVKVSDDQGNSYVSDVIDGIAWVIANRQIYNIRVMNLSLESSVAESYLTSALDAMVEAAWFNGILVVVAAGNNGANTVDYPPVNDPFAVTVGAADMLNTASQSDDGMAPWSSYGTTSDGVAKPEIVAPGRYMTSVLASPTSVLAQELPSRLVGTNYFWLSGTSMAAGVVSGLAALLFQVHPTWSNDQVKWVLTQTATRLGPTSAPLVGQGAGEANVLAALQYPGTPGYANQGVAISTYIVGPSGATTYSNTAALPDASSWSASSWSASSWSASSWSASSWSASSWSASSWSASSWSASSWSASSWSASSWSASSWSASSWSASSWSASSWSASFVE